MSGAKRGFLVVAVTCLMGTSTAAWACDVFGSVVCATNPDVGVSGVQVIIGTEPYPEVAVSTTSGADGSFATHVDYLGMWYDVNLVAGTHDIYCGVDPLTQSGAPIHLDPILVDDVEKCGTPPPPPPPPTCVVTPPANVTFPYCPRRPIGNPKAECGLFGLAVLDKAESTGRSVYAAHTAPVALVKAGGCYDVFYDVVKDVTLLTAPYAQGLSHETYCVCK